MDKIFHIKRIKTNQYQIGWIHPTTKEEIFLGILPELAVEVQLPVNNSENKKKQNSSPVPIELLRKEEKLLDFLKNQNLQTEQINQVIQNWWKEKGF